jgi:magnesium chelatase subunit D
MLNPNPNFNVTLTDPLIRGLTCATINPGLRSILVFDAPYADLKTSADTLTEMLEIAYGLKVEQVRLGVSELDDDLWGTMVLSRDTNNSPIIWHWGSLVGLPDDSQMGTSRLRLVIIPDLTRLSLAASRACVVLMGAGIAHLERYGQHEAFQPNICWLAGCAKIEVGAVSPHLLDRFALRLTWQGQASASSYNRVALLRQMLDDEPSAAATKVSLSPDIKAQIQGRYNKESYLPMRP